LLIGAVLSLLIRPEIKMVMGADLIAEAVPLAAPQ
jgi:hypothetical protein